MARRFLRAERRAYNSGKGYAVASRRRRIRFKSAKARRSFQKGYSKGISMMRRKPGKYRRY